MRRVPLIVFAAALVLGLWPRAANAVVPTVDVVKVDGSIDRTVVGYLEDELSKAEADGSTVVIQLDSAGTLDQPAVELAKRIFDANVPVIVWVGPAPAKAAGAGLLFMYAASLTAVAPGVGVGPLLPLDLATPDAPRLGTSAIREMVLGWAAARDKPTPAIPAMWPAAAMPAQDALDRNVAQLEAGSVPDLLAKIDGRTVQTGGGPVTIHTKIAEDASQQPVLVRFIDLGPVDKALHAVASPSAIYLLLVLGFAALAFELTQPGFGFAGTSGVAMIALAVYGLTIVPSSWVGLGLLVLGILLLTADVMIRKLGALTVLGLAAFLGGSLLAFARVSDQIDLSPWLVGSFTGASLLYYGFALTVAVQSRERITSTQRGLVGLVGETRGELAPEGPVFVKGTLWRGRSADEPIPPGTRVRVRGLDGLTLRVEPEPEED
jgi:membrane-bound serine protease (ClpP class)